MLYYNFEKKIITYIHNQNEFPTKFLSPKPIKTAVRNNIYMIIIQTK